MQATNVVLISQYRKEQVESQPRRKSRPANRKQGSVYARGKKLWVSFQYLNHKVREATGLTDSKQNRAVIQKQLHLILAEIENGVFEFAVRFPHSSKKDFFTELEGRTVRRQPEEIIFGEYAEKWFKEMGPGMSDSLRRDYRSILKFHLMPYFGTLPFSEIWSHVCLRRFIVRLQTQRSKSSKKPLSPKRIQNIMIPLRMITRDATDEFKWHHKHDPFTRLKLPKPRKFRIQPFDLAEWQIMMGHVLDWYRPYFEFAVQTGLRPSEQVALKWKAIDDRFIHIELSRVRNIEKSDLKTEESRRSIELRPSMRKVLEVQREMTRAFDSPYVFINTEGRPILQDKLREHWARSIKKSGLRYRRMYETRHTFASWSLAAGETSEWVARTLGHVNTAMIYRTYGRYIPNLTRQDGSAFERLYTASANEKSSSQKTVTEIRHNFGHNGVF